MSDDKFEEFLQREAQAYNAPPATVPREEMWGTIAQARAARRPVAGGTAVTPIAARRPRPRYTAWLGMAATLLVGIGIGRFALQRDAGAPLGNPAADVAAASSPDASPAAASPGGASAVDAGDAATPDAPRPATTLTPRAPAPRRSAPAANAVRLAANDAAPAAATPFQVASQRHLAGAEALVSAVASTPRDVMIDSLTGRWARDMLTNTRLLLDSPAGEDPIRRRLLEDLETVLVQLVQRSGAPAEDRAMIDRTLEKTQLLTRLRSGAAGI